MKKLLFILILFITSCTYTKVDDSTNIPNVITEQLKFTQIDSVYVIKAKDYHYYYNSNKELIEKYKVDPNNVNISGFFVVLFILVFFILTVILLEIIS